MMGKIADEIRPPLYPLTGANREKLRAASSSTSGWRRSAWRLAPIRIAVLGAAGKMGRAIVRALAGDRRARSWRAAVERPGQRRAGPGRGRWSRAGGARRRRRARSCRRAATADVWIDFSVGRRPASADAQPPTARGRRAGRRHHRPAGDARGRGAEAPRDKHPGRASRPTCRSGVNVLLKLVADAARALGPDYDIEIVETHHRAKRDAPSGTALRLAEALAEATGRDLAQTARYERHGDIGPRPHNEIGMQTLRGGDVVGDHTVFFLGLGDRVEITHRRQLARHVRRGAVRAALWLAGRPAGPLRHARRARPRAVSGRQAVTR